MVALYVFDDVNFDGMIWNLKWNYAVIVDAVCICFSIEFGEFSYVTLARPVKVRERTMSFFLETVRFLISGVFFCYLFSPHLADFFSLFLRPCRRTT